MFKWVYRNKGVGSCWPRKHNRRALGWWGCWLRWKDPSDHQYHLETNKKEKKIICKDHKCYEETAGLEGVKPVKIAKCCQWMKVSCHKNVFHWSKTDKHHRFGVKEDKICTHLNDICSWRIRNMILKQGSDASADPECNKKQKLTLWVVPFPPAAILKVCYCFINFPGPSYQSDLMKQHKPCRSFRSTGSGLLTVPIVKAKSGQVIFSLLLINIPLNQICWFVFPLCFYNIFLSVFSSYFTFSKLQWTS